MIPVNTWGMPSMATSIRCDLLPKAPGTTRVWARRWTLKRRSRFWTLLDTVIRVFFQPSVSFWLGSKQKGFAGICWTHCGKRDGWVHIQITVVTPPYQGFEGWPVMVGFQPGSRCWRDQGEAQGDRRNLCFLEWERNCKVLPGFIVQGQGISVWKISTHHLDTFQVIQWFQIRCIQFCLFDIPLRRVEFQWTSWHNGSSWILPRYKSPRFW